MQLDPMLTGLIIIVAALVLITLILWMGARRRKGKLVRDREHDNRAESLQIHPLSSDQRARYASEWEGVEARFVERPTAAVMEADELMLEILRQKGYPIRSFDVLMDDLSIRNPELVDDFRASHEVIDSDKPLDMTTEELRKAMLHYRNIYDRLVGTVPRAETPSNRDTEIPIDTVRETDRHSRPNSARDDTRGDDRPRLR
ncbi:MAG: hypothetical protein KY432_01065 [Acidobacteria bacterium]|nr:hypothetical protein [Acidobacteriota bacterium]